MAHVHQPSRLTMVTECVAVSGTVKELRYKPHDGDYWILVEPDPAFVELLAPSNEGTLIVEVIPTDQAFVYLPKAGQHATFYGSLVQDKAHESWTEVHPAWLITTLDIKVEATPSVRVGDELRISITATSTLDGVARPVSQVGLFVELVSSEGEAVRWPFARTNTRGVATVNLSALESPGEYTLWVYGYKGQEIGFSSTTVEIRRR